MKPKRPRAGKTRCALRSAIEWLEPRALLSGTYQLAFMPEPAATVATGALAPITVEIEDPANNNQAVPGDNSAVTLSIASGPTGATLGGTATVAAVNGTATF